MDSTALTAFADALSDDVAVVPDADGDSLASFLAAARPIDDDREILALLAALIRLENIVDHGLTRLAVTAQRTGLVARERVRSVTNLLTGLGMVPSAAARIARLSTGDAPAVSRAMRDGAMSAELGDAVLRGLDHVGRRVELSDDVRSRVTASLMVQTTPKAVAEKARAWVLRSAPDEPGPDTGPVSEDLELNEMTLVQTEEGRVSVTMDLDVLSGEELSAALDPLCRPVPEPDGSEDRRSARRRRANALGQIVRTYLSRSDRPESGGVLPHVTRWSRRRSPTAAFAGSAPRKRPQRFRS
ncbi:DUF222 domain-containing protein [Gordonia sp. (in: high G+C Gram-positive bacteria)]|uniref:DUF222 domain-containing protein n=1 Tax=Gordonia sp. (in: high G+C Gram-positive bacteria) TaxID=84139 RepID=UPI0039E51CE2